MATKAASTEETAVQSGVGSILTPNTKQIRESPHLGEVIERKPIYEGYFHLHQLFKNGEQVDAILGLRPKSELERRLEQALA